MTTHKVKRISIQNVMLNDRLVTVDTNIDYEGILSMWFEIWHNGEAITTTDYEIRTIIDHNPIEKVDVLIRLYEFQKKYASSSICEEDWNKHYDTYLTNLMHQQQELNKKFRDENYNKLINDNCDLRKAVTSFVEDMKGRDIIKIWNRCFLSALLPAAGNDYGYIYNNTEDEINRSFSGHTPWYIIHATAHYYYSKSDPWFYCNNEYFTSFTDVPKMVRSILIDVILKHQRCFTGLLSHISSVTK